VRIILRVKRTKPKLDSFRIDDRFSAFTTIGSVLFIFTETRRFVERSGYKYPW